jgi:hypothetical protein
MAVDVQPSAPKHRGFLGSLAQLIPRQKTPAEMAEEKAKRLAVEQQKVLHKKLKEEAEAFAWTIRNTLEDLNVCYRYPRSKDDFFSSSVKQVAFVVEHRIHVGPIKFLPEQIWGLTEDAIYLPIDLGPGVRPRGIGIEDLKEDTVLNNLSIAVGRKVGYWCNENDGFGYIVYRAEGLNAVPSHVKYDDILALRPASADSLSVPLGMAAGKRVVYRSLGQMVSMLVAGTTGGGKSNLLNVMIASLVMANSPSRMRICLIDLKRGVEFAPWLKLPHLMDFQFEGDTLPAIIDRREEVIPCLEWLIGEGERRLDRLKECGVKNIGQYNTKHPRNPLARIVIVVDEWADIKLDPKIGPAAQEALINVASRFRAAGFSSIVCTQYPQKEVVSMRLKAVLPAKIAFGMPNIHASIMVLNNDAAYGFNHSGRAVFQWGAEQLELQTPLINNDKVALIARLAETGEAYKAELNSRHDVTQEEICEWAVNENNGSLGWRGIYEQFKGRGMSMDDARRFAPDRDGEQIIVGASSYVVSRPTGPSKPWKLLPVDEKNAAPDAPPDEVSPSPAWPITPGGEDDNSGIKLAVASFEADDAQKAEVLTDADLTEVDGEQSETEVGANTPENA